VTDINQVGSEALTAVVVESSTFWNIKPCNPLKANCLFEGMLTVEE
jgi:hypothetical protein